MIRTPHDESDRPHGAVLVVDDNPTGIEAVAGILQADGHEVGRAESGREALTLARKDPPDLVLLDVMMPEMDGFEVCRRMRDDPVLSEVPIVMVTALDDRTSRIQALQVGADDFLTKPVDRAELRARVRTIVELNRYRKLTASRSRVEQLISLSPDGIVVVNADGDLLMANPAFRELVGTPNGESMAGERIWTYMAEGCLEEARGFNRSVLEGDRRSSQVELALHANGQGEIPVEVSAAPFPWEDEAAVEWLVRDVRERKEMEAQLQQSQRFEAIARLTGTIAHDFNNYLTAIVTPAELLLHTADLDREVEEEVEQIHAAGRRAARLCQQLLAFSRKREARPRDLNVARLLTELEPILQRLVSNPVSLRLEVPRDPLVIQIDPTHLEQIVVNLVVNARDATTGPGEIKVQAAPSAVGDRVLIRVEDEGAGMDEETRRKIFEPFFTTKDEGTGLGLSTVYGMVTRSDGTVEVESSPGEGTVFTLSFPATPEAERQVMEVTVGAAR